jgi:deazaflavin-dependent oxidoreductase (nitroreductase family)
MNDRSAKAFEGPRTAGDLSKPSAVESALNRLLGFVASLGLGPPYLQVLEVRGRRSGKVYATPVSILMVGNRRFLVAPRGRTQWVRNAQAAGRVTLRKGSRREVFELREVAPEARPRLLKEYLDRFRSQVQRFFLVPAGSPPEAFEPYAERYPVFELIPAS